MGSSKVKVSRHLLASSSSAVRYGGGSFPTPGMGHLSSQMLSKRPQRICVLGATGSVGGSTLDVISRHLDRYEVFALSAHSRLTELHRLCLVHRPQFAVVADAAARNTLQERLVDSGLGTAVLCGSEGLDFVASHEDVDTVVAAIVGAAGLSSTLAAVSAGKKLLLANKEALVMSGALFMDAVRKSGATVMPIDSEHNAIMQCLPARAADSLSAFGVRRILLTASGGPFRNTPMEALCRVRPDQACAHPTWSMGRKISVDSATLMNKGLELIEACWLFNALPKMIEVVIHPQSIVHSLVDYVDGSMLAHLGNPDMRVPIAHALAWPQRMDSGAATLDLFEVARLDFEPPDESRFPCLALARHAALAGGSAPAMLNASNEVAVGAFLSGQAGFTQIAEITADVLNHLEVTPVDTLEAVLAADARARVAAESWLRLHAV